mgnify:CR=1 FL=1
MKEFFGQKFNVMATILIVGAIAIIYGQLLFSYFATDEWWAFSYAISKQNNLHELLIAQGVYAPAANLFIAFLYNLFGVNAIAWALLTLTLHTINCFIIFWLSTK